MNNPTDEQIEILKQMQALGMKVSGSAIDNDPRIEADVPSWRQTEEEQSDDQ